MNLSKLNKQLNEAKTNAAAQKTARPRTAFLWGRADLLSEAIESILTADRNWRVIKALGNTDVKTLTQEVEKTHPEIVVINQGSGTDGSPLPTQLMESFPELTIITVNPDNNLVEVYNKQKFCLEEVSDLLAVIDKNSKSTAAGGEKKS